MGASFPLIAELSEVVPYPFRLTSHSLPLTWREVKDEESGVLPLRTTLARQAILIFAESLKRLQPLIAAGTMISQAEIL
jgi:hypothetical protein